MPSLNKTKPSTFGDYSFPASPSSPASSTSPPTSRAIQFGSAPPPRVRGSEADLRTRQHRLGTVAGLADIVWASSFESVGSVGSRKNSYGTASPPTSSRGSMSGSRRGSGEPPDSPGARRASLQSVMQTTTIPDLDLSAPSPSPGALPSAVLSSIPASPPNASPRASVLPQLLELQQEAIDFTRRRSVDVGVLGVGSHKLHGIATSKRLRDAVGPDSGDKEIGYVSSNLGGGKDRLVGRHIASILAHSLALCADPIATSTPSEGESVAVASTLKANESSFGDQSTQWATPLSSSPSSPPHSAGAILFPQQSPSNSPQATYQPLPPSPLATFPVLSQAKRSTFIANLQVWSFNAMEYTSDDLLGCVSLIFESVRNMEGVSFDLDRWKSVLLSLRSAYHARNGYHNFAHVADVTQACYTYLVRMGLAPPLCLLCEDDYDTNRGEARRKWRRNRAVEASPIGELLAPMDVFALLVAAIGHDVGHPGLSNAYMVNARTPVAQVYNDKSVLENFHTVTLIHMLRRHGFGYLLGGNFGHLGEAATPFRKVLESSILATDMSRHFDFVNELTDLKARFGKVRRPTTPKMMEDDRLLLCSGLLKCADISNPTRPHRISRAWATALLNEWSVQCEIETAFGLPISVMTIPPSDFKAQARSQVGFIDLFASPLLKSMAGVVEEFGEFVGKLSDSRAAWEAVSLQSGEAARDGTQAFRLSPAPRTLALSESAGETSADELSTDTNLEGPTSTIPPLSFPRTRHNSRRAVSQRHYPRPSDGSTATSSNTGSPLSPLFPGSVSSAASGSSILSTSASGRVPVDAFRFSCGGACSKYTATCETCSSLKRDSESRRGSVGRGLAILRWEEEEDDGDDERIDDDPVAWPPFAFRPQVAMYNPPPPTPISPPVVV